MSQDIQSSRDNRLFALMAEIGDSSRQNQAATDLFDERISDFLGINRTDGRCLDIVNRHGSVSAGQLANESDLTTGAVTAVIDRLEAAGYVRRVRDKLDRRKIWIECTPHVTELVGVIFGVYELIGPIMARHFTEHQLEGILAFLKMGTHLNQALAAGLRENTRPGAAPDRRLDQARQFRRAVDALTPRLAAELARLAPRGEGGK